MNSRPASVGAHIDMGAPALRTKNDVRWLGAAISAGERGMACSYGVILLQDLSCALADDNAGCHCVARRHAGHDGTVCDAKVVDSIDPEIAIDDCHGVAAHLGGTGLMPVRGDALADKVLEFCALHISWHHLALGEAVKGGGVTDLPTEFDARDRSLQIVRVTQKRCLDLNGSSGPGPVRRIRPRLFGRTT